MSAHLGRPSAQEIMDEDLQSFVDGELPPALQSAVSFHLRVDRHDRERVEAFRRQNELFQEIREAMAEDAAERGPRPLDLAALAALRARSTRARQTRFGAALAACLALVVVGGITWRDLAARQPAVEAASELPQFPFGGTLATSLAALPSEDGDKPVDWLSGQVHGERLQLPNLKRFGLKPVGGAVVQDAAVPAIRLVWADEAGNRLSLYAALVTGNGQQAFTLVPEGHVSMHWRNGDVVYALVAPTESRKLLDVVRAVAESWSNEAPAQTKPATEPSQRAEDKPAIVQPVLLPTTPDPAVVAPEKLMPAQSGSKATEKPKPL